MSLTKSTDPNPKQGFFTGIPYYYPKDKPKPKVYGDKKLPRRITLNTGHHETDFIICTPHSGTITIKRTGTSTWPANVGTWDLYVNDVKIRNIGALFLGYVDSAGELICGTMLEQGIRCNITNADDKYEKEYKIKFYKTNPYIKTIKAIQSVGAKREYKFAFKQFLSCKNDKIIASFWGHEEGGSYIYAKSFYSTYCDRIRTKTKRGVKCLGHNSSKGWFGSDAYYFEINLKPKKQKNK